MYGRMIELSDCPSELARHRFDALYRRDRGGRLVSVNERDGRPAPRIHLMRTATVTIAGFRADLPDHLVARLAEVCAQEPKDKRLEKLPAGSATLLELLSSHAPVSRVWAGPVFQFAEQCRTSAGTVSINATNKRLLWGGFDDWLPDVAHRQPFRAIVHGNRAISICASVRISDAVHCAGVETLAAFRRQGYAMQAASGWAVAVRMLGATPFYSTSWENEASQSVANRLNLALVGVDFHVT